MDFSKCYNIIDCIINMYVFLCCTIVVQYAALLFCWVATILILHFYRIFVFLELFRMRLLCCHLKPKPWIQENCIQNCDLFTGEQQVWLKFYPQHDHYFQLNSKGSRMRIILQTWCACMASTFCITFSIHSAYINFNKC